MSRRRTRALADGQSKGKGPAKHDGRSLVDEHAAFDEAFAVDKVKARAAVRAHVSDCLSFIASHTLNQPRQQQCTPATV